MLTGALAKASIKCIYLGESLIPCHFTQDFRVPRFPHSFSELGVIEQLPYTRGKCVCISKLNQESVLTIRDDSRHTPRPARR